MPRKELLTDMVGETVHIRPALLYPGRSDGYGALAFQALVVRAAFLRDGEPTASCQAEDGALHEIMFRMMVVGPPPGADIHCHTCGWEGVEEQLRKKEDGVVQCPACFKPVSILNHNPAADDVIEEYEDSLDSEGVGS